MNNICQLSNCTGCGACFAICPQNCISMQKNEEGFLYPQICNERCVECGLCERICPINNQLHIGQNASDAYAVNNKNDAERANSSSGGLFTLLARYVFSKAGVVFGAAFNENLGVEHIYIENMDDISRIQGSKYVQSHIGDNYKKAQQFLDEGRMVLFTGTPCQIGGLLSFLGKEYDNLICQDIVCHGCPSPMLWEEYVKYLESKNKSKIVNFSFRNKKNGWKNFSVIVEYENGKKTIYSHKKDIFMRAFLKNLCLRPSCYNCLFKPIKCISDITLADYWGVSHTHAELDDDRGTSLVLINSPKGERIFEAIKKETICQETNIQYAIKYNPTLIDSVSEPNLRYRFMRDLNKFGFKYVKNKYLKKSVYYTFSDAKKHLYIFLHKFIH